MMLKSSFLSSTFISTATPPSVSSFAYKSFSPCSSRLGPLATNRSNFYFKSNAFHSSRALGAGHSKWNNIRHKKAAMDAKRSKMFTKLNRLIYSAVKTTGGNTDVQSNPKLANAIDTAKFWNFPKTKIDFAIKAVRISL